MRKNTLDDTDIERLQCYKYIDEVVLFTHSHRVDTKIFLKNISETYQMNFSNIYIDLRDDATILDTIINDFRENLRNLTIDVTNASPLHCALITKMCNRFDIKGYFQVENGKPMVLNNDPFYFDDATPDEQQILTRMSDIYQCAEELNDRPEGKMDMCRSNIYKLLEALSDRDLIKKGYIEPINGKKTKRPFGYKFDTNQQLDYETFKIRDQKRKDIRSEKIKKKEMEKEKHRSIQKR